MTYLLSKSEPDFSKPARGADIPVADTWGESIGVTADRMMLEGNANNRIRSERLDVEMDILQQSLDSGATDILLEMANRRLTGMASDQAAPFEAGPREAVEGGFDVDTSLELARTDEAFRAEVFDALVADAEANPGKYEGIDLQRAAVDDVVNARLQAEHEELLAIEATIPEGRRLLSGLAGGVWGSVKDLRNAPWLVLGGGGGGVLRTMGREAMLNMGAEASQMPSRFEMAERLEIDDPNVAQELLLAGVFGATIGGVVAGGAKAVDYLSNRSRVPRLSGDPIADQQVVDAAEQALISGEDPLAAVKREIAALPQREAPPPGREPLLLRPEERVAPVDPEIDTQIAEMTAAVDRARAQDFRESSPLIEKMRRPVNDPLTGQRVPSGLQVHPDGSVGQSLKAAGITPRSFPGLFSRQGRRDFDNLPTDEWEEGFPGIREATGTPAGATYLDAEGFVEVLTRSANNDYGWLRSRQDVADLEARVVELEAAKDRGRFTGPIADYATGQRAERGMFVDRFSDEYEFMEPADRQARIASNLRNHLEQEWPGVRLTESEMREITQELDDRGGDADFLIERVLERELEYAELPPAKAQQYDDIPFGPDDALSQDAAAGRARAGGSGQDGRTEGSGRAGEGRAAEQTEAGEQALIDGVDPVSPTQRAMAERAAQERRRGDSAQPMDEGLFDLGARQQMDWLDDPASRTADPVMSQQVETIRAEIEADPEIGQRQVAVEGLDGNARTVTLAEWSGELDAMERAVARLDLCGKGPA